MWRAFALLSLTGCTASLQNIAGYEDRRSAAEVDPFTRDVDPDVRRRAFLALGRIQDPRFAAAVAEGLKDPVPAVRAEAAFATGLLGMSWQPLDGTTKNLLADALLTALARETDPLVETELLRALGRVPSPAALQRLLSRPNDSRAVLALALAVKRGAKLPELESWAGWQPGNASDDPMRYAIAYLAVASKVPAARPVCIEVGLKATSPETRALCAKALGDIGKADDAAALKAALLDSDVRVAVEAVRALVKLKLEVPPLDGRAPLLLAAAQAGIEIQSDDPKLKCRAAIAKDRKTGILEASLGCGALALHELAQAPPKDIAAVEKLLDTGTPAEQLGALDALGAAKAVALAPKIRPLLQSKDAILAAGAAGALAKLQDRESIPAMRELALAVGKHEDIAPAVADALTELDAKEAAPELTLWLTSSNATVRHTAAAALTKLTGATVVAQEVPLQRTALTPETGSGLLITTERGEIEIELWNDEAPRTAGNLWSLARKGYFDGLTFHRIVPDFVAQAGDPRGDGEGGPGYMIRCEIGHRPYVRGTVGMALSGKDTGGSQFFITHTATPHLDGKYTAFGQVKRGIEVVDALLEGDRMLKVTALP